MIELFSIPFMLQAFVAGVLLAGILAYFGVHVVLRGIVFVDLALAQISSLGVVLGLLIGFEPVITSIVFTFLGATLFAVVRIDDDRIPHEAFIGIMYAVASAAAILIVAKSPTGEASALKFLFGNILAVTLSQLGQMAVAFGLIGLFHAIFRKRFFLLSFHHERPKDVGFSVPLWNFLFYLSLGFVIAFAIRTGGVLLVFSYLIVPPVAAMLLARRISRVLVIAWIFGVGTSFFGLYFSFRLNLPTGATIICTFGLLLLLAGIGRFFRAKYVTTPPPAEPVFAPEAGGDRPAGRVKDAPHLMDDGS